MSEIEQVKQDAAKAVDAAKATEQKAINALNKEEGWVEKNPGKATLIAIVLFAVIVGLIAKSCGA